ncbi:hypothetical protein J1N35_001054 [Gossypium stocksii]|uniref:Uncharacterized protein n=1 Tax=Gossypium stocksii TaxID=47602 RepID=A0A9D4AL03_9ROSI|nr:hypothetical protein J1N35_001054 [Gossypium stocksii]
MSFQWLNKDCGFRTIYIIKASDNQTEGGRGRVSTGSARTVCTPKFRRRRLSAVKDFSPGCGRLTASNYSLTRQIAVDHSSKGGDAQDYLVLYVIRCVTVYTALIVNRLKVEGWAFRHMGIRTRM